MRKVNLKKEIAVDLKVASDIMNKSRFIGSENLLYSWESLAEVEEKGVVDSKSCLFPVILTGIRKLNKETTEGQSTKLLNTR